MTPARTHAVLFALPVTHSLGYVLTQLEDLATVAPLPPVAERLRSALSAFLGDYAPGPEDSTVWGPPIHLRSSQPLDLEVSP